MNAYFSSRLTQSFCFQKKKLEVWVPLASFMLSAGILQIRIYALYFSSKKILGLTVTGFVVCSAILARQAVKDGAGNSAAVIRIPGGNLCDSMAPVNDYYKLWLPPLAFDSVLCFLALLRGLRSFKDDSSPLFWGRSLFDIMVRDSIFYFLVISVSYVACIVVWFKQPGEVSVEAPASFSIVMASILSNRMVLNIRRSTGLSSPNNDVDAKPTSTLKFTPPLAGTESERDQTQTEIEEVV